MKKFQFSLENVLNYKNQVLEEIQNEYASAVQQVRQQEQRLAELEERYRALNREFRQAESGGITVAEAMGYESGLRVLEHTIRQAEERLQQLRNAAEQVRQRLVAARQDSMSLEKLRERKLEDYQKEMQKQEERLIDELVSNARAVAGTP